MVWRCGTHGAGGAARAVDGDPGGAGLGVQGPCPGRGLAGEGGGNEWPGDGGVTIGRRGQRELDGEVRGQRRGEGKARGGGGEGPRRDPPPRWERGLVATAGTQRAW